MQIKGLEGKTADEINCELERGGKFVVFEYCFSVILVTFKEPSSIYFVKAGEGAVGRGLGYTLLSLLLGWWGIPWGPIYTIAAVVTNIRGGKDVTAEILQPENTWADKQAFRAKPQDLAERFHKNFEPFAADTPEEVRQAGPKVTVAR